MTRLTKSDEERNQLLIELNQLTLNAYGRIDLRKALLSFDHDVQRAATWLVSGEWQAAKLISWNHAALNEGAEEVAKHTGRPAAECYSMLKNCGGSVALAIRTLNGSNTVR